MIQAAVLAMAGSAAVHAAAPVLHPAGGALVPRTITTAAPQMRSMAAVGLVAPPPASFDLTPWDVPIGDQGQTNSCVAWTIAHDLMGWYSNRYNVPTTAYAPMYAYAQINHGVDGGAWAVDAINLALEQGIDTESDYFQGDADWWDQPTDAERANAALHKPLFHSYVTLFNNYSGGGGEDLALALKSAISSYHPVAIAIPVRPGFDALSPTTPVDDDTTGASRGTHEILAVGYNADGLVIQNHWGTAWGVSGYGTLSWDVVEQDVLEAEVVHF